MLWNRRYVIKSYIRASMWLVPFVSILGLDPRFGPFNSTEIFHLPEENAGMPSIHMMTKPSGSSDVENHFSVRFQTPSQSAWGSCARARQRLA